MASSRFAKTDMEDSEEDFIYGFPKDTHIIYIKPDLEAIIVRIRKMFFKSYARSRSVEYQGLRFEVVYSNQYAESTSTLCTGILKYCTPKSYSQLTDLIKILTYFAWKNSTIISLIKDIYSKEIRQMGLQILLAKNSVSSPTNDTLLHKNSASYSREQGYNRGFHPYRKTTRLEESSNNQFCLTPRSNQNTPTFQGYNASRGCKRRKPRVSKNDRSLSQQQPSATSANIESTRNTGGQSSTSQFHPQMSNQYNFRGSTLLAQNSMKANHLYTGGRVFQTSDYRTPIDAPNQAQSDQTAPVGVVHPTRMYPGQLNQQPMISKTAPSYGNNTMQNLQQNTFGNLDQNVHYHTSRPEKFNPPSCFASISNTKGSATSFMNLPAGSSQAQFPNDTAMQYTNSFQNTQLHWNNSPNLWTPTTPNNHFSSILQNNSFAGHNQTQTSPLTSTNYLALNSFPGSQNIYRPENVHSKQSQQGYSSHNNVVSWINNPQSFPYQGFTPNQNYSINSQTSEMSNLTSNERPQDNLKWHAPSIPQNNTPLIFQPNQEAYNNHATNNNAATNVGPAILDLSQNVNPSLSLAPTNSYNSASINSFTADVKYNANPTNLQPVSNMSNIIHFQGLPDKEKVEHSINAQNLYGIDFIKKEPIDYEETPDEIEDKTSLQGSLQGAKKGMPSYHLNDSDDLDEILEIIEKDKSETSPVFTSSSCSDSSRLVIDEDAIFN